MKFLALSFAATLVIAGLGYLPTLRIAGEDAIVAMLAGCGISFIASGVGVIPVLLALRDPTSNITQAILVSTGLRFIVVLMLTLSIALSGWFETAPLLIWVAISYMALLTIDTLFLVRVSKSNPDTKKE
jgi:hypothetical protein